MNIWWSHRWYMYCNRGPSPVWVSETKSLHSYCGSKLSLNCQNKQKTTHASVYCDSNSAGVTSPKTHQKFWSGYIFKVPILGVIPQWDVSECDTWPRLAVTYIANLDIPVIHSPDHGTIRGSPGQPCLNNIAVWTIEARGTNDRGEVPLSYPFPVDMASFFF